MREESFSLRARKVAGLFRKRIRAVKYRKNSTRDENSILNQIYLKLEKSPRRSKKFENRAEFWDYLLKTVNSVLLDDIRRDRKFDQPPSREDNVCCLLRRGANFRRIFSKSVSEKSAKRTF